MRYLKAKSRKIFFHAPIDWNLVICVILLNIFGLIMIYSASYYFAEHNLNLSQSHFFTNQLKYVVIGLIAMFAVAMIGPYFYNHVFFLAASLGLTLLLIIAVQIPSLSRSSHGAARWITIGSFSLQIAEPVKLFMIIFSACFLSRLSFDRPSVDMVVFFGIYLTIAFLLLKFSNNMSTAMIIFMNAYLLRMLNSRKMNLYVYLILAGILLAAVIVLYIDFKMPYVKTENFRITRIRAWLHPDDSTYEINEAYQGRLALYAIASGGFFGKGLGQSLIKFRLPEPHNDYILAIIFEELGIFGVLILTYLFGYLLYRIFLVYRDCRRRFSANLVLGVFLHLSLQIVVNYCVTLGILPTMGVTLSFISAGGTSVLFTFIEIGLVLSAARENLMEETHRKAFETVSAGDPEKEQIIRHDEKKRLNRVSELLDRLRGM